MWISLSYVSKPIAPRAIRGRHLHFERAAWRLGIIMDRLPREPGREITAADLVGRPHR